MSDALLQALNRCAPNLTEGAVEVTGLKRLSGGASQETWAFDAVDAVGTHTPLILRRAPGGVSKARSTNAVSLATEAAVIRACAAQGLAVPQVPYVFAPEDDVGEAYVMTRLEGQTIARKILRDDAYAEARPKLARQCGALLAGIHAVPRTTLPELPEQDAARQFADYRTLYDGFDDPRPVFELAFQWLEARMPGSETAPTLVHGDFRNGNLMIGPDGVRAALDWELTHLGDPMEDLGWICVNSWRFGQTENPVGGFGSYEDLFAGYEDAGGGRVDPDRVKWWETFGVLKWGIMCMMMVSFYRSGGDRSVERAAIGRRASETEIDLMNLIAPEAAA